MTRLEEPATEANEASKGRTDTAGVRALNRGVREAARWYQFRGLKMVAADADGNPVEIDPADVLARLDAADCE